MKHSVNFSTFFGRIGQILLFLAIPLIYFLSSCGLKEVTVCFDSLQTSNDSIQVFYKKKKSSAFTQSRAVSVCFSGGFNFQVPVILPSEARINDEIRIDIGTKKDLKLKIAQIRIRSFFQESVIAGNDILHAARLINLDHSGTDNGIPELITRSNDPQIVLNNDWNKFASIRHGFFFLPLAGLSALRLWILVIIISFELLLVVLLHPDILARVGFIGKFLATAESDGKMQSSNALDQRSGQKCDPNGRLTFLDVLKGLAIIAVICNHCMCWSSLCPLTFLPGIITYYSVSLFILCAGYTSALSLEHNEKRGMSSFLWIRKKVVHISVCYLAATAVYLFFASPSHLILFSSFIKSCVNFDASGPFYYIAFFLQLLCVAPFFYYLFSAEGGKLRNIFKVIFYFFTILIAYGCIKYTRIGTIYGGGRFLLGGSFLILYVTGQIIYIYRNIFFRKNINLFLFIIAFSHLMLFQFSCFDCIPSVNNVNPPGLWLIFYAVAIFFGISFLFRYFPHFWSVILSPVSFLGKYSLEIFLYHELIIRLSNNYFRIGSGKSITAVPAEPGWNIFFSHAVVFPDTPVWRICLGVVAFAGCLVVPVIFTILYRYGKKWLTAYMQGAK